MQTENSIVIKGDIDEVFSVVQDVERYPEFMPQFKETEIIKKDGNKILVKRRIKIGCLPLDWQSEMVIGKDRWIKFTHLTGLLRGMETEWRFKETEEGVEIRVFHNLEIKIPIVGRIITFILWEAFIKKTAEIMLKKIKERVEGK